MTTGTGECVQRALPFFLPPIPAFFAFAVKQPMQLGYTETVIGRMPQ